jgi:transposase InsO family protein
MTKKNTRRDFTDEFKREAVSLLRGSGRPLTQVAAELGLQPSVLRRWRGPVAEARSGATVSRPTAPNLLARQFASAVAPNQVWLADMTYIATAEGWLYLAVVLDLFSRKVVGWAMSETMPQELTLSALHMAITNRRPIPGLLHHSDRGSQLSPSYLAR